MPSIPIEILYALEFAQLILSIGVFISALFTGGTIVLGIACLFLLSSDTRGFSKRSFLLRAYVVLLLLAVIGLEVAYFLATNSFAAFHVRSIGQLFSNSWTAMLGLLIGLTPAIVTGITDGLLVWRCYAVHQAFEQAPSTWRNIFWIFPALLWILNMAGS
ncbi:hypothetical protein P691DRAFT_767093 [Macrolepiota fuliginosa MF-IS2]|uniref:Uncharacterized protein n=1 Tax=Macrolepiota fuliginosa MF-IS2 TaxID=1400762 RepID=A0A9P5WYW8_9AGAR|nr:hypothetical protein P691DRAFT_767093 [Macrolepiota fuliginosa MF-IS2]